VIAGCCFAAGAASGAFAGLLASSAMMRRMEARISSIEGSCAFAACVIAQKPDTLPALRVAMAEPRPTRITAVIPLIRQSRTCGADGWRCPHKELWTWAHATALDWARSASVGSAHAGPGIAHLLVVHVRVIDRHPQSQHLRRQPSHRRQKREGSNYPVA